MKNRIPSALGLSSLLTIFACLCLSIFAILSISTVQSDGRLSDNARQAVQDYYEADCCAEEILARIRSGQLPEGVSVENGVYTYYCALSETQILLVQAAVEGEDYQILRWQAVSTTDWQPDDTIHVWSGAE